jgi:aspartyl-tRNA(Asn)/glutamyl-tRNA(Gln) amidotransferase subunit A
MDQIEATSRLNMFVTKEFENAMKLAKESDKRRQEGKTLGPLDGIPVGIKDIFCTKNSPTTAASTMLEGKEIQL